MNPLDKAEIGSTGVRVTRLGMGGAPIANLYSPVGESAALDTVHRALELDIGYIDTAPFYGHGLSETLLGHALEGVARASFVLSTKVGRVLEPVEETPDSEQFVDVPRYEPVFDYSRDGIQRSLEDSLRRLGLGQIEMALMHDPDDHYAQAIGEAYPTLADLRSEGVVKAIGVGMNQWQMLARFARETDVDCFLVAGRYTLLDQSALPELMPLCEERGISVILGGPYNSGILASDLSPDTTFDYFPVTTEVLKRARAIKAVCDRHGVPLKAAALQFGLAHPAVAATIPGARSASEVEENLAMAGFSIPAQMWVELRAEGHISADAPLPPAE